MVIEGGAALRKSTQPYSLLSTDELLGAHVCGYKRFKREDSERLRITAVWALLFTAM